MCVELDMNAIHVTCICILVQDHVYYPAIFIVEKVAKSMLCQHIYVYTLANLCEAPLLRSDI